MAPFYGWGSSASRLQSHYEEYFLSLSYDLKFLSSARGIFVDTHRVISEEGYQTSYHVRKLKNGNGRMFLCDTWSRYLEKLQFMFTGTRQISTLRSQDVSKEILSDLVRKDIAEFSDKFCHFQYATLEMFKGALNDYSMLKLRFFNQHPHFCNIL